MGKEVKSLEIRQLEYFRMVSEVNSFTRAAERLYVSQPAVTNAIRSLEEELGIQLFDRNQKQVVLTAEEIRSICQSFLGTDWDIQTQTTREIKTCEPDTFYLCAKTQEAAIARYIPEGRRFILDLYPTTIFFLAIAGIPRGETVYVFNNLLPYTKRLAQECRDLGIDGLCFVPVAYEEMEEAQVWQRLRKAR